MVATVIRTERAQPLASDTDLGHYIQTLKDEQAVALFLTPDNHGLVISGIDNCFYDPDNTSSELTRLIESGSLRVYHSHSRELSNRIMPALRDVHGRPIEELLWIVGHHGYHEQRCCLSNGCRRDDVIRLLRWPNFTRLPVNANSIKLASLFSSRPTSIVLASRILNIPEEDVMQFYNAACYSGLAVRINRPAEMVQPRQHRQQGLIGNLLRYLGSNRFGKRQTSIPKLQQTATASAEPRSTVQSGGCGGKGKSSCC